MNEERAECRHLAKQLDDADLLNGELLGLIHDLLGIIVNDGLASSPKAAALAVLDKARARLAEVRMLPEEWE